MASTFKSNDSLSSTDYSSIEFDVWICHLLPSTSDVVWEHLDDQSFTSSPSPQSISLNSTKPKKCLENLLLHSKEKQKEKWVMWARIKPGGIRQERTEMFYVMFVILAKRVSFYACHCQWGNGAICWLCSKGLPKIQHFCFLFAILFGFYLTSQSAKLEEKNCLPKIQHFSSTI